MGFHKERDLYAPVSKYMKNRSFRCQAPELPFYEYRMDIYGYSKRSDQTIAVELKLKRWSRALQQALIYQLCSDLVYIALPFNQVHNVDKSLLREHGIGLISVREDRCREIVAPCPSGVLREHYRSEYLKLLEEGG